MDTIQMLKRIRWIGLHIFYLKYFKSEISNLKSEIDFCHMPLGYSRFSFGAFFGEDGLAVGGLFGFGWEQLCKGLFFVSECG